MTETKKPKKKTKREIEAEKRKKRALEKIKKQQEKEKEVMEKQVERESIALKRKKSMEIKAHKKWVKKQIVLNAVEKLKKHFTVSITDGKTGENKDVIYFPTLEQSIGRKIESIKEDIRIIKQFLEKYWLFTFSDELDQEGRVFMEDLILYLSTLEDTLKVKDASIYDKFELSEKNARKSFGEEEISLDK